MKFILQELKCTNCGHLAIGLRYNSEGPYQREVARILTAPHTCDCTLWRVEHAFPCEIPRQDFLREVILDDSEEDAAKSARETLSRVADLLEELSRRGK